MKINNLDRQEREEGKAQVAGTRKRRAGTQTCYGDTSDGRMWLLTDGTERLEVGKAGVGQ